MNTDLNFDFTKIEDKEEQTDYLLSPLRRSFCKYTIEEWTKKLVEFTNAVYSDTHEVENKRIDYSEFTASIKVLIREAWLALQKRNRTGFTHECIGMPWKKNPYSLDVHKICDSHRYRTSYKRNFDNKITLLSAEETRDFFLVFDDFFNQLNVLSWIDLLDIWLKFSASESSIISNGYDYTPHETHRNLQRLIEACYLASDFVFSPTFYPPNAHLFAIDYMMIELYSETYDGYNPFLMLGGIFSEYELSKLKSEFAYWMRCAIHQNEIYNKDEPCFLLSLHSIVTQLLEVGWLILYTEEMPAYWLDPEKMDADFDCHKVNTKEEAYDYLKTNEQADPAKALRKFFKKNSWFHYKRMNLNQALYYALQTKETYYNVKFFEELEKEMSKFIEILYALNRDFMRSTEEVEQ